MWVGVLIGSAACYLLKLAGLSIPGRILADPRIQRVATLLPIALLAALALIQTASTGKHLVIDARATSLAVAVLAVLRRAPFVVVVALAVVTAALIRLAS